MTLTSRNIGITFEYMTDQFQLPCEGELRKIDPPTKEWNLTKVDAELLTQIQASMNVTLRSSLPNEPGPSREWYVAYADHCSDLKADGTYAFPRARPEPLDWPHRRTQKNPGILYDIEQRVREAFPDYNVEVKLTVHSPLNSDGRSEGLNPVFYAEPHKVFHGILNQLVDNLILEIQPRLNRFSEKERV